MDVLSRNKQAVIRFNKDVIERGNLEAFNELMAQDFINRTALPSANDAEAMWNTFNNVLHPAFANLKVEILDQIAENNKVTTRKAITGTHTGILMGVAPTNRAVRIDVIDIVRLDNGKYKEHWGINNLQSIVEELRRAPTGQTK